MSVALGEADKTDDQVPCASEPLAGKRAVSIEDYTAKTWVKVVVSLPDNHYKQCSKVTLVEDHLSAHRPCTFYEVYEPATAKAYLDRIEFVFTPEHGSWLNMAGIERSVLNRVALKKRMISKQVMQKQMNACLSEKNKSGYSDQLAVQNKRCKNKTEKIIPESLSLKKL